MSTDDGHSIARVPFSSNSKGDETTPVATDEILFTTLDFAAPGFAFWEFGEPSVEENCLCIRYRVERSWRGMNEGNEVVGIFSLGCGERRHLIAGGLVAASRYSPLTWCDLLVYTVVR
jgi:hypothetical protein